VANKVVAIGASAGGLEPLRELLRELPPNFAAAIIVAVHSGPESRLKNTLDLFSDISLEICHAESGIEPTPGVVYVCLWLSMYSSPTADWRSLIWSVIPDFAPL